MTLVRVVVAAMGVSLVGGSADAQWARQESGTTAEFRGLHAASERVVWATGRNGVYARTTDGGATWHADTIPGAEDLFLVDVHAFSGDRVCVLSTHFDGGFARIYHTADAGATWDVAYENSHPDVFLDGLAFWDARYGVAFGDPVDGAFFVVRSEDGCVAWTRVPRERLPAPLEGEAGFAASGTAIAVFGDSLGWIGTGGGSAARVLRTANRGRTWTPYETPMPGGATSGIFGIAFRDDRHGVAVGGNYRERQAGASNVLWTDDSGHSWTVAGTSAPLGVRYGAAYVPGTTTVMAVGPSGLGYSTDNGRTWTAIDTVSVNTVTFARSGRGWVAGVGGRIFRLPALPSR